MSSIPQPASQPRLLSGTPIAARIRAEVKRDVAAFRRRHGYAPSLAVVLIGGDAPSAVYLQQILKTCRSVGIEGRLVEIAEYCCFDVKCTKLVHEHGIAHGKLHYTDKFQRKQSVAVNWGGAN